MLISLLLRCACTCSRLLLTSAEKGSTRKTRNHLRKLNIMASVTLLLACLYIPNSYAASSCGGDGERACCAGTFEVWLGQACDYGNVEVAGCSGDCTCGGLNPFGIQASGTCKATTSCGGEGQRACCNGLTETTTSGELRACNSGLVPVAGCAGNCYCGGSIATGQVAQHTCAPVTECGGEGQRACCVGEPNTNGACNSGLTEIPGCSGDCSCGTVDPADWLGGIPSQSSGTCARVGSVAIEEPQAGWSASEEPRTCALRGYADLHNHLFAHLAHGGRTFAGESAPVDDFGQFTLDASNSINSAMSQQEDLDIHGTHTILEGLINGDTVGAGTKDGSVGTGAPPYFNNWPTWTTTTHQQMYYPWVERAFRGGMRLTTMLAVTNEALCKSTEGSDCANSMGPIDAQIEAAYDFQRFIDENCAADPASGFCAGEAGAKEGWFRIVTSPLEARQVISEGKLAVVLGIEVDNLFNCKEQNSNRPEASCPNMRDSNGELMRNELGEPIDTVTKAVNHYFDKGVRHFFPIHNFDNAFGGAATWNDIIAVGNAYSEQRWWHIEDCGVGYGEYGSRLSGGPFDDLLKRLIGAIGFDSELPVRPIYPLYPACNRYGLNLSDTDPGPDKRGLGSELFSALMDKGMIIDIDHMSRKSLDNTLALTRLYAGDENNPLAYYPLVASHVQFFDLHQRTFGGNQGRHERMRTKEQLEAIRDGGGMIAAMTKDDVQDTAIKGYKVTLPYSEPLFGVAIKDNCRHSSRTFAQAYQYAVDVMGGPVALGSDFNGVAGHVGPRFGANACGSDIPTLAPSADVERSAQLRENNKLIYPFTLDGYGTFDKQLSGFKAFDFNVDGLAHVGLLPDLVKDMENIGLAKPYNDALFESAEQYIRVWERALRITALKNGNPLPESPAAELTCPRSNLCQGDNSVPAGISCPAQVVKECTGPDTEAQFADPSVSDGSCGVATFQGCIPGSGSLFSVGDNEVTCAVMDSGRNTESCFFNVTIQDTQEPEITAPADVLAVECTSPQGASPELGLASAADICDLAPVISNDALNIIPIGANTITWTATDGSDNQATAPQLVEIVDTVPPQINCPQNIVAECSGNRSATLTPGAATGSDLCSTTVALSQPSTQSFPMGITELTYTATDAQTLTSSCTSTVKVEDTLAPQFNDILASPHILWPPNHEMIDVVIALTVNDVCDNSVPVCRVTDISSNESSDGKGDGSTEPDWSWNANQTGTTLNVQLRAEREGSGDGRTYTIDLACSDLSGNTSTAQTTVYAPKNNN
ncbi:HYR domain-containing protein [Pseudoalteromonas sp. T1lg10]|uniref:HYR domain-containing protein n=1 Tax=Pseudoalteromonas sp. T1lg10 TaxID=2077093 RepID=UPI000CF64711|nr:HYR domain-containing protein [Pseudoalteromonas sp. T1lg10]